MSDVPKTSFIPKQTLGNVPSRVQRRRHFNVFGFVGMVVFLCGMILAVGVYLYRDFSQKDLEARKQELQNLKNSFSQSDIQALRELDRRIGVSRALMNKHLSPSVLFDALELRTQQEMQFTNFAYSQRESGSVELVLKGTALRFNTVALQSQQLADAETLASTIFSGFSIDEAGTVSFTMTSEGDVQALAYVAPSVLPPPPAPATTTVITVGTTTIGIATTTAP